LLHYLAARSPCGSSGKLLLSVGTTNDAVTVWSIALFGPASARGTIQRQEAVVLNIKSTQDGNSEAAGAKCK